MIKARLIYLIVFLFAYPAFASAKQQLDLYTWRQQELLLWDKINRQNLLNDIQVNVKVIDFDTYQAHIQLAVQNRRVDLFQWMPGAAALAPLIEHGVITAQSTPPDSINPNALPAATGADSKIYGVPFAMQLEGMLINQKLLAKHGLTVQPRTISQLESLFAQLKSHNVTPLQMASDQWYLSQVVAEVMTAGLLNASRAKELIAGQACFTDSDYLKILETLKHWYAKGYINQNVLTQDYHGMGTSKALGNSAIALDGGWRAGPNSVFYQVDKSYKVDFWPVPGESGHFYGFADGTYQINAKSKQAELAQKVLHFTTTKTFANLFANTLNEIPAYGGQVQINSANLRAQAKLLNEQSYDASLFTAPSLNQGIPSYQQLVAEAIKQVFSGNSPQQAAAHIQKGLNSWHYIGEANCQL
ncbi:ABC transporter substrate-binding protein [Pseudoalteromonas luteoviolacea]|uniref:ABC transporter substrate-binding protein n=1 Tax=Pseudoalteromonas luteoviolacea TaxID=43657 RepID=UPI001B383A85|nr:extracellular solute-binding protein [Pseudoalteromonas luteoviolacea]MBQ4837953.1 extracellular solute-binding protein [Pseudoalteromonas luteoviolacea]